ncbi:MAG: GNAT family N-acetyltransferase [Spirochaetia bacterium]
MALRRVTSSDLPIVYRYLCVDEWRHTMLSSRFFNAGNIQIQPDYLICISEKNGLLCGLFLSDKRGYILVSQIDNMDVTDDLEKFCRISKEFHPPYCIAGTPTLLCATEKVFRKNIRTKIQYHLMTSNEIDTSFVEKNMYFDLCKSQITDHKTLFPLELKYQQEEVFDRKLNLQDEMALSVLYMEKLKRGICAHAIDKKKSMIVAKAEISYIGFHYGQLGGVYTLPEFRNKGIAQAVITSLIKELAQENKNLSLFVKKSNRAAVALYNNLGLKNAGEFAIHYVR